MSKYTYPAIFTPEKEGGYSVAFPDLDGCYTCGEDMKEAVTMAEDALALTLYGYESEEKEIPPPSTASSLTLKNEEFSIYIACDTLVYEKIYDN